MIYLKSVDLPSRNDEKDFFFGFSRTCFDSGYPFGIFSRGEGPQQIEFSDVTFFSGGNGSGKSTLLNVIAERLALGRKTAYNKTYFFDPYCKMCHYSTDPDKKWNEFSKIITSDEVFDHILSVRHDNEVIFKNRNIAFETKSKMNSLGGNWNGSRPRDVCLSDNISVKEFSDYVDLSRLSASQFVRRNVGVEERTFSNGENGYKYFAENICPGGLYLLDEPENSLSAQMQTDFVYLLHGMAAHYGCQFVISSHSPFLLSMPGARVYDLDTSPIKPVRWTELENMRIFHQFFKEHEWEFID